MGESQLKCPVDGSAMSRMVVFGVEIDVSFSARIVWLDYNEYEIITSEWLADTEYVAPTAIPDVSGVGYDAAMESKDFFLRKITSAMYKLIFR